MFVRPWIQVLPLLLLACGGQASRGSAQSSSGTAGDTGGMGGTGGDAATSSGGGAATNGAGGAGACVYPAKASTVTDASSVGCSPGPSGQICQVSNGATVLEDGGVANGTETCTSQCGASAYELTCTGGPIHAGNAIPDPDPSLGCTIIPQPTPPDVLFYCCPCGGP